ncbi:MAG: polysaccharide biosynthesis tyrosine autokinase [Deltaproteobacteria bacterium]|nr:polysaccharide biosynthesis tyrosine autokinase [Deltaproteobacteria bacterium]
MKRPKREANTFAQSLLSNYPSHSRFAEAYRTLRTNINFAFVDKAFRSLLITSSGEMEGKTTTVYNLCHTLAQAGRSVLMVDADLRKPMLSKLTPSKNGIGLTGLLSGVFGTEVDHGSLSELSTGDLIRLCGFQKKTGVLHLNEENEKADLFFHEGELADVHWLTRPENRKLATLLVKDGVMGKQQVEQALMRKRNTGQKLGYILISLGLMKEDDLAGYISLHMVEGLRAALQMKKGTYSFEHLSDSHFQKASFDPTDLRQLYRQVVIGEEELPYLQQKIQEAIQPADTKNLFVLPSGPRPPKPAELLESSRMDFLLDRLKSRYDVVVLDSPPLLPTSDALVLAPHTDGVILMIKAGQLNREMVKKAVDQIHHTQANLIGVVLNDVDTKREGYYKYYHKYYARYYGEGG